MTREEMVKRHWRPYMQIEYRNRRMKEGISCLLVGISFDDEIMELQPLGENYQSETFFSSINCCHIPKREIKVAVKHGKIIKDEIPNIEGKSIQNFHNTETGNIDKR